MKFRLFITVILLCGTWLIHGQNHFDNSDWQVSKKQNDITLYTVVGENGNYYKSETTFKPGKTMKAADLMNALNDYKQYLEIFKKVLTFEPVLELESGTVMYTKIDFFPMKNRVYYIILNTTFQDEQHIMYWEPYPLSQPITPVEKGCILVSQIAGRWIIRDNPDGTIYVSNEYHNNWEYRNLSIKTARPFEENITIKNLALLLEYMEK